jgi:hypothetical protein
LSVKENRKKPRKSEYVLAIIANFILFYILNNLLSWNVGFVTSSFQDCLLAINMSIAATVIGNILLFAYDPRWFRHLFQFAYDLFGLYAVYTLYRIFPFNFGQTFWNEAAKIALILGIIGVVIGLIVKLVKLILNKD